MEMLALLFIGLLFLRLLMSLIYCIVTSVSSIKAIKHGRPPLWSHILIGCAGIMLFLINFFDYYYVQFRKPALAAIFLVLIHICAIVNNRAAGNMRIRRHVLRLLVSVLIFALFFATSPLYDAFVWRAILGLDS